MQTISDLAAFLDALTKNGGILIAAAVHLIYVWTPRKAWEPRAEDMPPFVRLSVNLLVAVGLVTLIVSLRSSTQDQITAAVITLTIVFVIILVVYAAAFLALTRTIIVAVKNKPKRVPAVVGFWLRKDARANLSSDSLDHILAGHQYKTDEVWTGWSLFLARIFIALLWAAFLITGTLLLAAAATLVSAVRGG